MQAEIVIFTIDEEISVPPVPLIPKSHTPLFPPVTVNVWLTQELDAVGIKSLVGKVGVPA